MEIVNPSAYYDKLKRYWRRRRYQRLNGENYSNKRKLKITRLGGSGRRRQWRIRSSPKLRLSFIVSPIKLLAKFHDSYVNMMLRLAGNVGKSNSVDLFGGKRVPKGRQISLVSGGEEVDGSYVEAVPLAILLELAGNL
ncbi:uncharacterized protein LOC121255302 [Juglans microcarpa x Juglans regia]|uniref:uncharacterized protein LOC121255302 n=1 Tax=Juglans microcarpa x Juglans regia TaxID=2249226 RepID=UPI001B7DDC14|nr:uncharacterized protein LOC121255302 [Juglans microcarpa x Juglans regia]